VKVGEPPGELRRPNGSVLSGTPSHQPSLSCHAAGARSHLRACCPRDESVLTRCRLRWRASPGFPGRAIPSPVFPASPLTTTAGEEGIHGLTPPLGTSGPRTSRPLACEPCLARAGDQRCLSRRAHGEPVTRCSGRVSDLRSLTRVQDHGRPAHARAARAARGADPATPGAARRGPSA
jgi:hypothetical protein